MTTRTTKFALLTTVSAAAAAFIMPGTAAAQATCAAGTATATNNVIACVNGAATVATGTTDLTTPVAVGTGGQGLFLNSAGNQTSVLTITAPFATTANSAIRAVSGGTLNFTSTGAVSTTGNGGFGDAIALNSTGALVASVGNISTTGTNAFGLSFGSGAAATLTTGNISTTGGSNAVGILGNSTGNLAITAGTISTAGTGVNVSSGGTATVNTGAIVTTGDGYDGVLLNTSSGGAISVTTASVSTNGVNSDGVELTGTGAITTSTGNVTTTGADSIGLNITGGAGNVAATFGNISTAGTGASYPVLISTTSGNIAVTGGNTVATGAGQIGVNLVSTTGTITGTTGTITANGAGSQGLVVAGGTGGLVTLTTGAVSAAGNGVVIDNGADPITLTTGAVTSTEAGANATRLNSTGAITFTGGLQTANAADALQINGGAGAISATVAGATTTGAAADGVQITGTGPLTFSNTGPITTSGAGSIGLNVSGVTTAAVTCGNVSNTNTTAGQRAVVIAANGDTTVTCGTVSTAGPTSDAITVTNTAGFTTVTGGTTTAPGAGSRGIVVSSSAPGATTPLATSATGRVTVNSGVVTTNGDAVVATSTGGGNVVVNATGNVTSAAGNGITATTSGFTSVTIAAGTTTNGVQGVALNGTAGNTLIVNGTLRNIAGTTTPYTVLAGGPFTLTLGAAGVITGPLAFTTGADTFNLNGTFSAPVAGLDFLAGTDVLNIGSTGVLRVFGGATTFAGLETLNNNAGLIDMRDGDVTDRLTFAGNYAATGNARLGVDVAGAGNLLTSDRLIYTGTTTGTTTVLAQFNPGSAVIDPVGALIVDAGTVAAGQFVLGGTTSQGLINYSLETRGSDVFLVSRPDEVVFDQLFVGRLANDIWYQSAEAYQSYAMSRRIDYGNERKGPIGIWSQLYASKDRFGDRNRAVNAFSTNLTTSGRFETERRGAQSGLDFGAQNFVVGVTAGYEHAEGLSDLGTDFDIEGYNYGAYAQFGAQQGIYAGLLLKRDDYDVRIVNNALGALMINPDGRSTGVDGEVGFRFGSPGSINIDVGAGLSYVRSRVDGYRFGNVDFDGQRHTSTRGRLQARASFAGMLAPFIDGKLFREFGDANDLAVRSGLLTSSIEDQKRGTWGRVEAGLGGGAGGGPLISGWVDLGDVKGFGARAGFRF